MWFKVRHEEELCCDAFYYFALVITAQIRQIQQWQLSVILLLMQPDISGVVVAITFIHLFTWISDPHTYIYSIKYK